MSSELSGLKQDRDEEAEANAGKAGRFTSVGLSGGDV